MTPTTTGSTGRADSALAAGKSFSDPAGGLTITFTCVPRGSGVRIGVDRDGDGFWDGDELDASSDPADATSTPAQMVLRPRKSAA